MAVTVTFVRVEKHFYTLLEEHISSLGKRKRDYFCIDQEKYDKAIAALQLPKGVKCPEGSQFKFWCIKHFKLHKTGSKTILYCKKVSSPVVTKDLFDTIKR